MSYTKITDFSVKDVLLTGNPAKLIKGSEINAEFNAIQSDSTAIWANTIAVETHAASGKSTPIDADEMPIVDTAAANVLKKLTWVNLKATLKTYFDTLYLAVGSLVSPGPIGSTTPSTGAFTTLSTTTDSAFNSKLRVGSSAAPAYTLDVTGNSRITGQVTGLDSITGLQLVAAQGGSSNDSSIDVVGPSTVSFGTAAKAIRAGSYAPSAVAGGTADAVYAFSQTQAVASTFAQMRDLVAGTGFRNGASVITNYIGLDVEDHSLGTNNYGIRSQVSSGTNKWNLYISGTADNAILGNVKIGATTAPTAALDVTGSGILSGSLQLGTNVGGTTPRQGVYLGNDGYNVPSNGGANSNGDKFIMWNTASFKAAMGIDSGKYWFQSTGSSGSLGGFRFYGGTASAPVMVMDIDTAGRLLVPNGTVVAPVAFASLPASPITGQRAMINNSVAAPAFLSTAAGGGATTVPVFYNGTSWLVG